MNIPFVDLQAQYETIRPEVMAAVEKVFSRAAFILGEEVDVFEKEFAAFCGGGECVTVATGCDALLWALKACDIGPGDEVITVANTFIATALAITAAGARPVLVDCLESSYQIDPEAVRRAITPRTKAIIPVHLYGQAADMDAILAIAKERGLRVIEDAAQAHGATYKGRPCGLMGDIGCFSFFPGKNLGAYGDGGAIVTNNSDLAQRVRMLRNYGQSKKYHHEVTGWNSRLDTVQAAILSVKLKRLPQWNDARRVSAARYNQQLVRLPIKLPEEMPGNRHVYHLYVARTPRRDELLGHLKECGIAAGIHYPVPIHRQKAYCGLGYAEGAFPITERLAKEVISFPMYPELNEMHIEHMTRALSSFFQQR